MLDLSKIEAGELTLDLADYSLKEVVQTVFTAVESLATGKKLALTIDVAPNLPRGHGDERRLVQVLLNLVGNAIKFTDKGEVAIKATMSDGSFTVAVLALHCITLAALVVLAYGWLQKVGAHERVWRPTSSSTQPP